MMQFGTFLRSAALAAILAFASAALADLRDDRAAILATHRTLIVLLAADPTADARTESAESRVGKILFHEGHERMQRFAGSLADAIRRWNPALGPEAAVEEFLRFVESSAELRDADKLAFRDALAAIAEAMNALPGHPAARAMAARIATDLRALDEIQRLYDRELGEIHSRLGTRALERRRESWESVVAFVRGKYSKEDILREYAHALQ
ncbi:MAG: hypothetical protein ACRET3_10475, partial [Burkholderiales bacterium]